MDPTSRRHIRSSTPDVDSPTSSYSDSNSFVSELAISPVASPANTASRQQAYQPSLSSQVSPLIEGNTMATMPSPVPPPTVLHEKKNSEYSFPGMDSKQPNMAASWYEPDEDTHKEVYSAPAPMHAEFMHHSSPEYDHGGSAPEVMDFNNAPEVYHKPDDLPTYVMATEKNPDDTVPAEAGEKRRKRICGLSGWKLWTVVGVVALLALIAIIVGAVVGANSGSDSSENAKSDESQQDRTQSQTSAPPSTTTTSAPAASSTPSGIALPDADAFKVGNTYNTTFTHYGSDPSGTGMTCKRPTLACGFYADPGYTVGVSQNLYGAKTGDGEGPACGTCWRLQYLSREDGKSLNKTITAKVTDLCASEGNGICAQKNLEDLNDRGGQVNFNLCIDSGASTALFTEEDQMWLALGTATVVDCDEWEGKQIGDGW